MFRDEVGWKRGSPIDWQTCVNARWSWENMSYQCRQQSKSAPNCDKCSSSLVPISDLRGLLLNFLSYCKWQIEHLYSICRAVCHMSRNTLVTVPWCGSGRWHPVVNSSAKLDFACSRNGDLGFRSTMQSGGNFPRAQVLRRLTNSPAFLSRWCVRRKSTQLNASCTTHKWQSRNGFPEPWRSNENGNYIFIIFVFIFAASSAQMTTSNAREKQGEGIWYSKLASRCGFVPFFCPRAFVFDSTVWTNVVFVLNWWWWTIKRWWGFAWVAVKPGTGSRKGSPQQAHCTLTDCILEQLSLFLGTNSRFTLMRTLKLSSSKNLTIDITKTDFTFDQPSKYCLKIKVFLDYGLQNQVLWWVQWETADVQVSEVVAASG